MIDVFLANTGTNDAGEATAELDVTYSGALAVSMQVNAVNPLLLMQPGETESDVMAVLKTISDREKAGEGTPVTVALVDALNLRSLLLDLAMSEYP
ncbi:MAG: hypothetical protein GY872_20980 [Roseibacillus sp.]|nr:hypothetical protein [Roseibacillus sp.]